MDKYECTACGYIYDPAVGDPDNGIPAGTRFEDFRTPGCAPSAGSPRPSSSRSAESRPGR